MKRVVVRARGRGVTEEKSVPISTDAATSRAVALWEKGRADEAEREGEAVYQAMVTTTIDGATYLLGHRYVLPYTPSYYAHPDLLLLRRIE